MSLQPEICYTFTPLSLEEINRAYENDETVTAFVESVDPVTQTCQVHLGNSIFGVLPFNEVTVYPLKEGSDNIPIQIHAIKERKIRVKITAIHGDKITLSRKKNMIFASRALCKGMKVTAHVKRYTPEVVYLDVGEGLTGSLHARNINVEGKIRRDDIIEVKILNASNNRRYTLAYDNMDLKKYVGRILEGTVTGKISDNYFVEFPHHVNGILQVYPGTPPLANGTTVKCFVRACTSKGLKLYLAN